MKIISGGQTGVDRAALDIALVLGIPHGGFCPRSRLAEDGTIPLKYNLIETHTSNYGERTKLNIKTSDASLVLAPVLPITVTDGTILTINELKYHQKPHLILDLSKTIDIDHIVTWIIDHNIQILNIAGPRESQFSGIYQKAFQFLKTLFIQYLNSISLNTPKLNFLLITYWKSKK